MSVKQDLKILTIGNSFTDSLVFYFADVVKSAGFFSTAPTTADASFAVTGVISTSRKEIPRR